MVRNPHKEKLIFTNIDSSDKQACYTSISHRTSLKSCLTNDEGHRTSPNWVNVSTHSTFINQRGNKENHQINIVTDDELEAIIVKSLKILGLSRSKFIKLYNDGKAPDVFETTLLAGILIY